MTPAEFRAWRIATTRSHQQAADFLGLSVTHCKGMEYGRRTITPRTQRQIERNLAEWGTALSTE